MPSVPNSWRTRSFIAGVDKSRCSWFSWMLFGNDGYVNRNGLHDSHKRVGNIGVSGERSAAHHSGGVHRVCDRAFNAVHALIWANDGDFLWIGNGFEYPEAGYEGADHACVDVNFARSTPIEAYAKLCRHNLNHFEVVIEPDLALRQVKSLFADTRSLKIE